MSKDRRQWTQPQLIVLTRGNPEERVLTHCKRIGQYESLAHLEAQQGCDKGANNNCGACQARAQT